MQRAYGHAFNAEELAMYDQVISKISRLVFERFSPLGEVKDLTNPKDKKNIEHKRKRGVSGYNIYSFDHNGTLWQVKTEVFNNSVEAIYHIMKKK